MRRLFYSLLYVAERAQKCEPNMRNNLTHEREKHRTEPFKRLCARPMLARKCAAFFPLRPFSLSYLRFIMFRKKNFEKIFP